jgi:hypothetical protein
VFLLIHAVCTLIIWGKLQATFITPDKNMESFAYMNLLYSLVLQSTMQ